MSHEHENTSPTRQRCQFWQLECTSRAQLLVATVDGDTFALCSDHCSDVVDVLLPSDTIADVVELHDHDAPNASTTHVDAVQTFACVGYELLVEHFTIDGKSISWNVRPSYARESLVSFATYSEAMRFAVDRNVAEFEQEVL